MLRRTIVVVCAGALLGAPLHAQSRASLTPEVRRRASRVVTAARAWAQCIDATVLRFQRMGHAHGWDRMEVRWPGAPPNFGRDIAENCEPIAFHPNLRTHVDLPTPFMYGTRYAGTAGFFAACIRRGAEALGRDLQGASGGGAVDEALVSSRRDEIIACLHAGESAEP